MFLESKAKRFWTTVPFVQDIRSFSTNFIACESRRHFWLSFLFLFLFVCCVVLRYFFTFNYQDIEYCLKGSKANFGVDTQNAPLEFSNESKFLSSNFQSGPSG